MNENLNHGFRRIWSQVCRFVRLVALGLGLGLLASVPVRAQVTGAIFTTDSLGAVVNGNVFYQAKSEVYLDGGPAMPGAAGLPDGFYHCQVTTPNGGVLGRTPGADLQVVNGEFVQLYQLSDICYTASSLFTLKGYDDTTNSGGEYKVWISTLANFKNSESKTDNFKVREPDGPPPPPPPPPPPAKAKLCAVKFYDANANGVFDVGELQISDWLVRISGPIPDLILATPSCTYVDPGVFTVTEFEAVEDTWVHTTPAVVSNITLRSGDDKTVYFGNVCIGAGGGKTLGFWSNKNGQKLIGADDLALLVGLHLRNGDGSAFDPAGKAALSTWLLNGKAVNMAYMLSVQLSAMELNVFNGLVNGSSLVYAPELLPFGAILGSDLNDSGFITVANLMKAANAELEIHPVTTQGSPFRAYQEALKNALDDGNNNLNFVQALPCPFSFSLE